MWFLGLPTGGILLLLNRHIPESPRFLLARRDPGDVEEAQRVMESFGVEIVADEPDASREHATGHADTGRSGSLAEVFRAPFRGLTVSLGLFGLAWGLVNFGFLLWLPTNLREVGLSVGASDALLARSAILAFPAIVVGAWLYHVWSSKYTMVLFGMLTAATLLGFAFLGDEVVRHPLVLNSLLVLLLVSSSGVIAMLSPYTAEVYPVHIRATGSGWSAGCSKGAGALALGASAFVGFAPGITVAAVAAAVPTVIACAAIAAKGVETRGLGLEVIQEARVAVP
jgi:putative MFS transporter